MWILRIIIFFLIIKLSLIVIDAISYTERDDDQEQLEFLETYREKHKGRV